MSEPIVTSIFYWFHEENSQPHKTRPHRDSLLSVLNLPSSVIKGFTNKSNTDCPWYTEYRKTNYVTFVSSFFDGGKSQNELTSA